MRKPLVLSRIALAICCLTVSGVIRAADFQVRPIAEHETDATKNFTLKTEDGEQTYPVETTVLLDARSIKFAEAENVDRRVQLKITLTSQATERFATQSAKYVGLRLAIMVGDTLKAAPKLQTAITGGKFAIALNDVNVDDLAEHINSDATGLELAILFSDLSRDEPGKVGVIGQLANISDHDITVPTDGLETDAGGNPDHFDIQVGLSLPERDEKDRPLVMSIFALAPVTLHPGEVAAFKTELDAELVKQATAATKITARYKVAKKAAKRYKFWSGEVVADDVKASDLMAPKAPQAK